MIKSVLVYLNPETNATGVLQVALELAGQHRAHLIGLALSEEVTDERPALERTFHERAGQRQVSHEWSPIAGDEAAVVVLEARCHDLLVIGQTRSGRGRSWWYPHRLLEDVLWKSGHPLIVVPCDGVFSSVGERVLVGWDGAREAARAVKDAMPILERAKQVTLVTVDLRSGDSLSVGHLVPLLERHGVQVSVQGGHSHGRAIGDALLAQACEQTCDLLVMGGHAHTPRSANDCSEGPPTSCSGTWTFRFCCPTSATCRAV